MKMYQMIPRTPVHFGERGIGQEETAEFPHSDTLFAALISAWRLMYPQSEFNPLLEGVTRSGEKPPIRLSSAFPYVGEVFFLPRPAIPLEGTGNDRKKGKKVAYISWGQAQKLVHNDVPHQVQSGDTLMGGRLWLDHGEKAALMETFKPRDLSRFRFWSSAEAESVARVTVDRTSAASMLFYQGATYFAEGCGFYFLADVAEDFHRKALENGLHFLGEHGLGGRRSVGLGQFNVKEGGEPELGVPEGSSNYYWLLSLYHPTADEVKRCGILEGARYNLITRRGWIYSPDETGQRRRGIRMLAEGSLLTQPVFGEFHDVRPKGGFPHAVWRSGLALTVTARRWRNA